jgi:hypothetical protein
MGEANVSVESLLEELANEFGNDEPKPGEFTIQQFHETLIAKGVERTLETARVWLNSQVNRGKLSRRTVNNRTYYRRHE